MPIQISRLRKERKNGFSSRNARQPKQLHHRYGNCLASRITAETEWDFGRLSSVAGLIIPFLAASAAAAQPVAVQPARATIPATPAAATLFERDWVLMNWALKYFDANHDILIDPQEAEAAAAAFRNLADTNHDGRVTPEEYRAARAEILSHD